MTAVKTRLRDLVPEVSEPWFDLATEPWVDVTDTTTGERSTMSLREVLTNAHGIDLDDSRVGPLTAHGLTRLLTAFAYLLHAHSPAHPWKDVAAVDTPLPATAINWLLDRFATHLWLQHPSTPFLQRPDILDVMDAKKTLLESAHSYWTLVPDVPARTNPSWFNRDHEEPPPAPADAANVLVARHYFALPGNEAPNDIAGGKNSKGGPTGMTNHGRSYLTFAGGTLAQTLARNLLTNWTTRITVDTPTYFEQPTAVAANLGNPLWVYTASAAATVLIRVEREIDPLGWVAVRTPAPLGKRETEALKEALAAGDPHTLRIDARMKGQARSYITFPPDAGQLEHLRRFHVDAGDRTRLHTPSLLLPYATLYRVRGSDVVGLHLSGGGSSMGPVITHAAVTRSDSRDWLLSADRAAGFVKLADRIVGQSKSAATLTAHRVKAALRAENLAWVTGAVRQRLYNDTERVLRTLLDRCADEHEPLPDDVPDDLWCGVVDVALSIYDDLTTRYTASAGIHARVFEHRHMLAARLRRNQ